MSTIPGGPKAELGAPGGIFTFHSIAWKQA